MTLRIDAFSMGVVVLAGLATVLGAVAIYSWTRSATKTIGPGALIGISLLGSGLAMTHLATLGLLASLGVGVSYGLGALVVAGAAWAHLRTRAGAWETLKDDLRGFIRASGPTVAVFVGLAVLQAGAAFITLARVGDIGWDAATYHLPIVGAVVQEGSLFNFPDLRSFIFYPALVEVQATLVAAGFGSMHLPSLVQVGYLILGLWIVGTLVAHRTSQSVAIAAMLVAAAIPSAWLQARTLHSDVAFAVVLLAAVVTAVVAVRERSPAVICLAALLTGALPGMKLGAPASIPVAAVVVLAALWRPKWRVVMAVVVLGVIGAAPYMLRNTVEFGLPFYPLDLTLPNGPVEAYPGYAPYSIRELGWFVDTSTRPDRLVGSGVLHATLFQYVESPVRVFGARLGWEGGDTSSLWARFDARFGGFGISWLAFMGLGLGAAGVRAVRGRAPDGGWRSIALLVGLALVTFAVTQASWWPRFVIGVGFIAVVAAGLLVPRGRWWSVSACVVALLALFMTFEAERSGGYFHWTRCDRGGCVATSEGRALVRDGLSGRTLAYQPLVERDPDSVVLVAPDPNVGNPYFPVSLWAPNWDRRVENLPIDSPPRPGFCREVYVAQPSSEGWLRGWLSESDPGGEFESIPWADPGGERLWVLRRAQCEAGA